jgi:hypothetical protein
VALKQKLKEKIFHSKIASVVITEKMKAEAQNVAKVTKEITSFNEINFQKLLESQLESLLTNSKKKFPIEIESLKALKGVHNLKAHKMPTINATAQLSVESQKTLHRQAIDNLVKNRGGAWEDTINVKSLLGKLYKRAVSVTGGILLKIKTYRREIIIVAGICIAVYAILSVLKIHSGFSKHISIPKNLSDGELIVIGDEVLAILRDALEEYLELTGGKVKNSETNFFASAQIADLTEDNFTLLNVENYADQVKRLDELSQGICSNIVFRQILSRLTGGRYILTKTCMLFDRLQHGLIAVRRARLEGRALNEEFFLELDYLAHRILCAFTTTDKEFGEYLCPKIFSDLVQPSARRRITRFGTVSYFVTHYMIPSATAFIVGFFVKRLNRNIQPEHIQNPF